MKEIWYLKKYFIKYKKRLIIGTIFVVLSNLFKVISPKLLGKAVDVVSENIKTFTNSNVSDIVKNDISKNVLFLVLAFFAVALVSGLFTFLMRQSIIVMSRLIENDLRNEIYIHYQKLDQSFYKRNNTGDLMNRATEDVSKVRMFLGPAVMYSINVVLLFSFVIYSMLSINVNLTFWVLLPMPLLIISIYKVQSHINIRSKKIQEKLSDLTTQAQEFYSGIRVIKSFVQEKFAKEKYTDYSSDYMKESLKMAKIEALFFPLMILLIGLSTVIVVFVGGIKLNQGHISSGNIIEFIFYVNMLTWPISSVGWVATLFQTAVASQKRINEYLKTKPTIVNGDNDDFIIDGNISFNKVNFTYKDTGVKALQDISFEIKSGERWLIMGKTGSGKTSLVELIMRLYDCTSGSINISKNDIKSLNLSKLRSQIAYIPQDVFLFSDTITNNINFSKSKMNVEKVTETAKDVAIHNEIMSFPKQYETIVGERGVTLSGGQKQRIAIARAIIKDSNIFIFDDSLSALDTKTEKEIFSNLNKKINYKTVLIVTHRIPKYFNYDKILVLEDGKILEIGNHLNLMGNKSYYHSIYNKQLNNK